MSTDTPTPPATPGSPRLPPPPPPRRTSCWVQLLLVFGLLAALAAGVALITAGILTYMEVRWANHAIHTTGIVTRKDVTEAARHGVKMSHTITYWIVTYTADGKQHDEVISDRPGIAMGDPIPLVYAPDRPELPEEDSFGLQYFGAICAGLPAIFLLLLAVLLLGGYRHFAAPRRMPKPH